MFRLSHLARHAARQLHYAPSSTMAAAATSSSTSAAPFRHQGAAAPSSRSYSSGRDSFLNGSTSIYVEEMFAAWQQDPASVHKVCVYFYCLCICLHTSLICASIVFVCVCVSVYLCPMLYLYCVSAQGF